MLQTHLIYCVILNYSKYYPSEIGQLIRRLLFNLYGNQHFQIRWNNCLSNMYNITNRVKYYLPCILMGYFMNSSERVLGVI